MSTPVAAWEPALAAAARLHEAGRLPEAEESRHGGGERHFAQQLLTRGFLHPTP